MILAISYSDEVYQKALKFNLKRAKRFGADKVIGYGPKDLSEDFKRKNKAAFDAGRGGGLWIWKPYIINDALSKVNDGDIVVYTDAGSAFVNKIHLLIDVMEAQKTDVMCFCLEKSRIEKQWSKRDAILLSGCDGDEAILNSPQHIGGYILIKKSPRSVGIIQKYLEGVQDFRAVSDEPSSMGLPDYEGFQCNRHDQTVWSLLTKKEGIKPFRDPSQFGLDPANYSDDVLARSTYPQVIDSHRRKDFRGIGQLTYKKWYRLFDIYMYRGWLHNSFIYPIYAKIKYRNQA